MRKLLPLIVSFACANSPAAEDQIGKLRTEIQQLQQRLEQLENLETQRAAKLANNPPPSLSPSGSKLEQALEGINLDASFIAVGQKAEGINELPQSQLNTRFDLEIELPGGTIGAATGKFFAHLRGGDGDGVNNGAFATSNATVFGNNPQPALVQAWYQLNIPFANHHAEITLGKIDPFEFFDGNNVSDDESEGFLNLAFVHNPLLDAGGDIGVGKYGSSPGMQFAYAHQLNENNQLIASTGVFSVQEGADYNRSFYRPFSIIQLEYAGNAFGGREGNYRLYGWNNAQADDQINLDIDGNSLNREKHRGWGISINQMVTEDITLFARYGHSLDGLVQFDRAFTLGGQIRGALWGRENDRLGFGYGQLKSSSELRAAGLGSESEKINELFYALQINEHIQLTPSIQYLFNPAGISERDDVTIYSLRAKFAL